MLFPELGKSPALENPNPWALDSLTNIIFQGSKAKGFTKGVSVLMICLSCLTVRFEIHGLLQLQLVPTGRSLPS